MVAPTKRVILKTKNVTATELNLKTLDLTPQEGKIYESMYRVQQKNLTIFKLK
jgi:hypothetical protein